MKIAQRCFLSGVFSFYYEEDADMLNFGPVMDSEASESQLCELRAVF